MSPSILPGTSSPLGASADPRGTNFAVSSGGDAVTLCRFDRLGSETRLDLPERDGDIWHGFVPGVGAGRAYGFRMNGPFDPARGLRYNPAKLLPDPYARAIEGDVLFAPELLGHSSDNACAPSILDSQAHVPRSIVVAPTAGPAAPRPRRPLADTVIYEAHVRDSPPPTLRCRHPYAAPGPAPSCCFVPVSAIDLAESFPYNRLPPGRRRGIPR